MLPIAKCDRVCCLGIATSREVQQVQVLVLWYLRERSPNPMPSRRLPAQRASSTMLLASLYAHCVAVVTTPLVWATPPVSLVELVGTLRMPVPAAAVLVNPARWRIERDVHDALYAWLASTLPPLPVPSVSLVVWVNTR